MIRSLLMKALLAAACLTLALIIWRGHSIPPPVPIAACRDEISLRTTHPMGGLHLAVLCSGSSSSPESDLTAIVESLVSIPGVALVERQLINALFKEHQLQLDHLTDPSVALRIGQLLQADLLLLIEHPSTSDPSIALRMRVIESRTGAVVGSLIGDQLLPLKHGKEVSDFASASVSRSRIPAADRLYVDVRDFRNEEASEVLNGAAMSLSLHLRSNVLCSSHVVVVEREQLHRVIDEKNISRTIVDPAFSGIVVEGGIRRWPEDPGQISMTIHLYGAPGTDRSLKIKLPFDLGGSNEALSATVLPLLEEMHRRSSHPAVPGAVTSSSLAINTATATQGVASKDLDREAKTISTAILIDFGENDALPLNRTVAKDIGAYVGKSKAVKVMIEKQIHDLPEDVRLSMHSLPDSKWSFRMGGILHADLLVLATKKAFEGSAEYVCVNAIEARTGGILASIVLEFGKSMRDELTNMIDAAAWKARLSSDKREYIGVEEIAFDAGDPDRTAMASILPLFIRSDLSRGERNIIYCTEPAPVDSAGSDKTMPSHGLAVRCRIGAGSGTDPKVMMATLTFDSTNIESSSVAVEIPNGLAPAHTRISGEIFKKLKAMHSDNVPDIQSIRTKPLEITEWKSRAISLINQGELAQAVAALDTIEVLTQKTPQDAQGSLAEPTPEFLFREQITQEVASGDFLTNSWNRLDAAYAVRILTHPEDRASALHVATKATMRGLRSDGNSVTIHQYLVAPLYSSVFKAATLDAEELREMNSLKLATRQAVEKAPRASDPIKILTLRLDSLEEMPYWNEAGAWVTTVGQIIEGIPVLRAIATPEDSRYMSIREALRYHLKRIWDSHMNPAQRAEYIQYFDSIDALMNKHSDPILHMIADELLQDRLEITEDLSPTTVPVACSDASVRLIHAYLELPVDQVFRGNGQFVPSEMVAHSIGVLLWMGQSNAGDLGVRVLDPLMQAQQDEVVCDACAAMPLEALLQSLVNSKRFEDVERLSAWLLEHSHLDRHRILRQTAEKFLSDLPADRRHSLANPTPPPVVAPPPEWRGMYLKRIPIPGCRSWMDLRYIRHQHGKGTRGPADSAAVHAGRLYLIHIGYGTFDGAEVSASWVPIDGGSRTSLGRIRVTYDKDARLIPRMSFDEETVYVGLSAGGGLLRFMNGEGKRWSESDGIPVHDIASIACSGKRIYLGAGKNESLPNSDVPQSTGPGALVQFDPASGKYTTLCSSRGVTDKLLNGGHGYAIEAIASDQIRECLWILINARDEDQRGVWQFLFKDSHFVRLSADGAGDEIDIDHEALVTSGFGCTTGIDIGTGKRLWKCGHVRLVDGGMARMGDVALSGGGNKLNMKNINASGFEFVPLAHLPEARSGCPIIEYRFCTSFQNEVIIGDPDSDIFWRLSTADHSGDAGWDPAEEGYQAKSIEAEADIASGLSLLLNGSRAVMHMPANSERTPMILKAISEYDSALRLMPTRTDLYGLKAYAHFAIGDFQAAIADCDAALIVHPDDADALLGRALAHSASGCQRTRTFTRLANPNLYEVRVA